MPHIRVNETNVWYEAYGSGPTVVYLQAAWGGRNPGAYYAAGRLSQSFRVIIWDSPNSAQLTESVINNTESENHMCCEYLNGLLDAIGETTVHLVGNSGGGELALLFAHLYPNRVNSVSMYRLTDTSSETEREIIRARYFDLAEVACTGSMWDVLAYSEHPRDSRWKSISTWLHNISKNSAEREKLLAHEPREFASVMDKWGIWMSQNGFYRANLSDEELRSITVPFLIVSAADPFHPEELAAELSAILPNVKYIPSTFFRTEKEMYSSSGEEHNFGGFPDYIMQCVSYLERLG